MTDWNSVAVLDRETGLVWEKTPTTSPVANPTSWLNARLTCANKRAWAAEKAGGCRPSQS